MPATENLLKYQKLVVIPPVIASALYVYFLRSYSAARRKGETAVVTKSSSKPTNSSNSAATSTRKHVGVNMQFFKQMRMLLPILVPGFFSKESALLISLGAVLIARTWLDIWFSAFNGQVVKAIVGRDKATFVARAGIEFGFMMWPLSIVNNSLKLLINALSISFRERLTKVIILYCKSNIT